MLEGCCPNRARPVDDVEERVSVPPAVLRDRVVVAIEDTEVAAGMDWEEEDLDLGGVTRPAFLVAAEAAVDVELFSSSLSSGAALCTLL